jgi:hypothetical protein
MVHAGTEPALIGYGRKSLSRPNSRNGPRMACYVIPAFLAFGTISARDVVLDRALSPDAKSTHWAKLKKRGL